MWLDSEQVLSFLTNGLPPLLIALVGWLFTKAYNKRTASLQELDVVQRLIEPITGESEEARAAGLIALANLGSPEIAVNLADVRPGRGAILACIGLLRSGRLHDHDRAVQVLQSALLRISLTGDLASLKIMNDRLPPEIWERVKTAKDPRNRNAVMLAARNGHPGVLVALLVYGIPLDASDASGETALHLAVKHRRKKTVGAILKSLPKEARSEFIQRKDGAEKTALDCANDDAIRQMLTEAQ